MRSFAEIIFDGVVLGADWVAEGADLEWVGMEGPVEPNTIAARIREAYTIRTRKQLDTLPVGSIVLDFDRDVIHRRDERGWWIWGTKAGPWPEIELPALLMPWAWHGTWHGDEELRSVECPAPDADVPELQEAVGGDS